MIDHLAVFRRTPRNKNSLAALGAAVLRMEGEPRWRVRLADSPSACAGANVVGFSFATPEMEETKGEIERLKKPGWRGLLIAGGPHPSADPAGTLALGFDAVFVGEGEETLPEFLRQLGESGRVEKQIWRPERLWNLDSAVHVAPELGLFPFVEISRGCPHGCAFCATSGIFGRRMRHRSPGVVAAGVRQAVRAGFRRFRFLSPDSFAYGGGSERQRARRLEELLAACRQAGAREMFLGYYPSEVRPEHVGPDILALVGKFCRNRKVQIGAQAGSERVLCSMRRGHDLEQVKRALRLIAEFRLQPLIDVIFGYPGECLEERLATLELVEHNLSQPGGEAHLHWYIPLPGTAAWPAPAERPEAGFLRRLERLCRGGRADGYWREQLALGEKILRWREAGLIRC